VIETSLAGGRSGQEDNQDEAQTVSKEIYKAMQEELRQVAEEAL
jgi:hypothetical protein